MPKSNYDPIKLYIASRFQDREDALALKERLQARGALVTSTWLTPLDGNNANMATLNGRYQECRARATCDLDDIVGSDAVVVMSPLKAHKSGTGGRHVELGFAVGVGKPVFLLGSRENVFHYLPHIQLLLSEYILQALVIRINLTTISHKIMPPCFQG